MDIGHMQDNDSEVHWCKTGENIEERPKCRCGGDFVTGKGAVLHFEGDGCVVNGKVTHIEQATYYRSTIPPPPPPRSQDIRVSSFISNNAR